MIETLVLPNNYVSLNEEEMEYLEFGATLRQSGSASTIRNKINAMISACWAGNIGAIGLGIVGGVVSKICASMMGAWFSNTLARLNSAHWEIEKIISKYGKNKYCYLTSTWSTVWCTGFSVST